MDEAEKMFFKNTSSSAYSETKELTIYEHMQKKSSWLTWELQIKTQITYQ